MNVLLGSLVVAVIVISIVLIKVLNNIETLDHNIKVIRCEISDVDCKDAKFRYIEANYADIGESESRL